MNLKAIVGTAVTFFIAAYVMNVYVYLPVAAANAAPGAALLPLWASLLVTAVIDVVFLDWVNKKINNAMTSALTICISQILLVDVYYVLDGRRSAVAAGASAVTLLVIWVAGGFMYGKLSASK